jgi:hypothetical protein
MDIGENNVQEPSIVEEPIQTQTKQLKRIFKYNIRENAGMVTFNTDADTIDYFQKLYSIHSLIDEKHDQLEASRGNDLKSRDIDYKNRLISAINYSTLGNTQYFETGVTPDTLKKYNVNSGIHTLEHALERLGDTFLIKDGTNVITAPSLPSLQILPWICPRTVTKNELANNMVVYKNFNTTGTCSNAIAGTQVKDEIGVQSNGFVHDTGSTGVFQKITAIGQTNGETRNIVSGKLDSSTTGGPLTNPNDTENIQTLIPFMNIYNNGGSLTGIIMVYVAPHDIVQTNGQYNVFLAFKYIPVNDYTKIYENPDIAACLGKNRSDNIAFLISNNGWQSYTITDQVPNLPDISDYMSGARGCFSAILKNIFTGSSLENKCKPYKDIAVNLWGIIGQSTIFQNDQDLFIMAFLMKVKWLGDLFRLVDSFMITEVYSMPTSTATIDTFMKRFACLSNLYVYCANKGGDLTINDVKTLTPEQIQEIDQRNRTNKIRNMKSKIEWYKSLISNMDGFKTNWIPPVINVILNGIFGKGNVTLKPIRSSGRVLNKLLQCLSTESYIYKHDKNKETIFALNEMSSILDYFLTLFCYNQAFNVIYETNIRDTVNGLPDIDIATVTDATISENEAIINGIEQNMNIIDKYNTISNFAPLYDNKNHRRLFEDSLRFSSMKDVDMSTAIQFFDDPKYKQLPKLVYTPQIGDTLREQFGNNIVGGDLPQQKLQPIGIDLFNVDNIYQKTEKSKNFTQFDPITTNRYNLINYLNASNNNLFKVNKGNVYNKTKELSIIETKLRLKLLREIAFNTSDVNEKDMDYDTIMNTLNKINWKEFYEMEIKKMKGEIKNKQFYNINAKNVSRSSPNYSYYKELYEDVNDANSMYDNIKYYNIVEKFEDSDSVNFQKIINSKMNEHIFAPIPENISKMFTKSMSKKTSLVSSRSQSKQKNLSDKKRTRANRSRSNKDNSQRINKKRSRSNKDNSQRINKKRSRSNKDNSQRINKKRSRSNKDNSQRINKKRSRSNSSLLKNSSKNNKTRKISTSSQQKIVAKSLQNTVF